MVGNEGIDGDPEAEDKTLASKKMERNPFQVVRKGKKIGTNWDIKKQKNAYFFGFNKVKISDTPDEIR